MEGRVDVKERYLQRRLDKKEVKEREGRCHDREIEGRVRDWK